MSHRNRIFDVLAAVGALLTVDAARPVVGGEESEPFSRSFVVALVKKEGHMGCGGTLISDDVVLTAAHCYMGESYYDPVADLASHLTAGVHLHDYRDDAHECSKFINASHVLLHPQYNPYTEENDAALVFLAEPAPCAADGRTMTVALDRSGDVSAVGAEAIVAGWGATDEWGSEYPDTLHEVALDVIDNGVCEEGWGSEFADAMMCARREGKDACFGDSGGPLFVVDADGDGATQIGIVSKGPPLCATFTVPGVFTRVSAVAEWILENWETPRSSTPAPTPAPTSEPATDPCAGFRKKRCKKQGSCSWNKNSKTCSDCSAISDKKACKKSCEWKQKSCQAVDCSVKSKKQCKKSKYKKACKYKKKRGGCIPK